jgi:hypothetical protein
MSKQVFVRSSSLWSEHFIEDEVIYLVPQKLVRKTFWFALATFCEPLNCGLSQVVQACGTEALLTVNE